MRRVPLDSLRALLLQILIAPAVCLVACGSPVADSEANTNELGYDLRYRITPAPGSGYVDVELELRQSRHLLREMRFDTDGVVDLVGAGKIESTDGSARWIPPKDGGRLAWRVRVAHARGNNGYDAWLNVNWGLFRAEDAIPRAATRTLKGAVSRTTLEFELPPGWSVVTEYREQNGRYEIDKDARRFVQPSGWIVMGELGVRRDIIAGVRVAVAAPTDQQVRRLDMLALLNWTLPELSRIVPSLPGRLTIVSAGDPMWRGGLSAPQSIYIHADRPLLSENGTSTLLHELMHVALKIDVAPGYDWIVEGLAEYYSLALLARSGTLSRQRYAVALEQQRDWAASATQLCARTSTGARTALAVVTFAAVDAELRDASDNDLTLDDLVHDVLMRDTTVDAAVLAEAARKLIGRKPDSLHAEALPGCRTLDASDASR